MKTYDDIAEWYDQWIGTHSMSEDPFFPAVEALIGEVKGTHICDLACGQGRVARHLAEQGARVVGIDLSAKLLAIARHQEETNPRGIEYVQANVQNLDHQVVGLFDGVVCFMALMDIPELTPTLHSVARILQPGGWFVFALLHPCFHTSRSGEIETPEGAVRTIGRYFVEGYWRSDTRPGPPGKIGAYHRTLSTYINTLTDAGLQLVRLSELSGVSTIAASPSLSRGIRPVWQEVPSILVASCRKPKESTQSK
ncbi:methyltransferase [Reticulibacter mediterranei]|uniref:Methyltransferase n=1 Tax=Reticulibacter mediterranei TaxID=2778369 RepID=A0A8J3IUJ2_9CHLR|nr:class I SAM-dependent methyltransferase [Reticulibacter mediterranei]GHO97140.1 methyltransferase [Reticulibacter mediterranei]